jgi:hypothetical protein
MSKARATAGGSSAAAALSSRLTLYRQKLIKPSRLLAIIFPGLPELDYAIAAIGVSTFGLIVPHVIRPAILALAHF